MSGLAEMSGSTALLLAVVFLSELLMLVGLLAGTAVGLVAIGHLVPGLTLGLVGVGSTVTAFLLTGSN